MSGLPPLIASDEPKLDKYYFVPAPWFVDGEIVEARFVGRYCDGDGPYSDWFRVDGHDILFSVGNEYMVRSNLKRLIDTLVHWQESELDRLTDPTKLEAKREGIKKHIAALRGYAKREAHPK